MKKQLLGLFVLTILYSACKKNETDPAGDSGPTLYIKSVINPRDSIVMDYNTDKTLKRHANFWGGHVTETSTHIYFPKYENGKPTSISFTHSITDENGALSHVLTYNAGGKVMKINFAGNPAYDSLAYDAQGKLAERYHYTGPGELSILAKFTWENKNIVKVLETTYFPSSTATVKTYKYDNKRNPFQPLLAMTYPTFYYFHYLSANNVTEFTYDVTYAGSEFKTSDTTKYQYEFNKENYPVKMTSSIRGNVTPVPEIEETRITYYPQ